MWALSVSFELEPYYDQLDHINHTLWEAKHNIFYKIDLKRREINGPMTYGGDPIIIQLNNDSLKI